MAVTDQFPAPVLLWLLVLLVVVIVIVRRGLLLSKINHSNLVAVGTDGDASFWPVECDAPSGHMIA